jgi:T5orf172 domain
MAVGFVYFLSAIDSENNGIARYKIGLTTRTVAHRLAELNSGQSPYALEEVWSIHVADCNAAEAQLHQQFAARRVWQEVNGRRKSTEWFEFERCELHQVDAAYRQVAKQFPIGRSWFEIKPKPKQYQSGKSPNIHKLIKQVEGEKPMNAQWIWNLGTIALVGWLPLG